MSSNLGSVHSLAVVSFSDLQFSCANDEDNNNSSQVQVIITWHGVYIMSLIWELVLHAVLRLISSS